MLAERGGEALEQHVDVDLLEQPLVRAGLAPAAPVVRIEERGVHDDERASLVRQAGQRADGRGSGVVAAAGVDQRGVRPQLLDQPPALIRVGRGADHGDARIRIEPPHEGLAGAVVVVDEDELQGLIRALLLHVLMLSSGPGGRDGPNVGKWRGGWPMRSNWPCAKFPPKLPSPI